MIVQKRVARFWACDSQVLTKMVGRFASLSIYLYEVFAQCILYAPHNE